MQFWRSGVACATAALTLLAILPDQTAATLTKPVIAAGCPAVTLRASTQHRVTLGKKVTVKITLRDGEKGQHTGVAGLYLSVQLPAGVTYAQASKSLPNEPVVWGSDASVLYWALPATKKKVTRFVINLQLDDCRNAALPQKISLPVKLFTLDTLGNQKCIQSDDLSTTIKKSPKNGWPACKTDTCTATAWHTIAPFGQQFGANIFGGFLATDGQTPIYGTVPISDTTSPNAPGITLVSPYDTTLRATRLVSVAPDIPTLHSFSNGKTYMLNNVEEFPATMYISELARAADGTLTIAETKGVASPLPDGPFSSLCTGSITPWNSKLVGEESCPDARLAPTNTYSNTDTQSLGRATGWYSGDPGLALPLPPKRGNLDVAAERDTAEAEFKPYNYGSIVEANVASDGSVTAKKLWTMGRLEHELSVVLPDNKTVITTDDISANGLIAMFVADQKGDLTSGELFAPRFTGQTDPINTVTGAGAEWDVSWISLGRATQAELDGMRPSLTFASIFDVGTCSISGGLATCPSGYSRVANKDYKTSGFFCECLKLKTGMEKAAAFFETRRYASMLGATVEFSKAEGVTYSKELRKVYVATTRFTVGMLDGATGSNPPYQYDYPDHDDIRLPLNNCGGILELDVESSTNWKPVHARIFIAGTPTAADAQGNTCDVNGIAAPDNIFVIPGTSTLLIAEDTGAHVNNVLWSLDLLQKAPYQKTWPAKPVLTRIFSAPRGAEVTGQYIGASGPYTYVTLAYQDPTVGAAAVGYLGPVLTAESAPRSGFAPGSIGSLRRWVFAGIPVQTDTAGQDIPVGTSKICIV